MEQGTLHEVLDVEKSLREALDVERRNADEWLDHARREIEREHVERLEAIRREAENAEEQARQGAVAGLSEPVGQSEPWLDAAQALTDDELRHRVRPHLAALVPERNLAR